jgi:hypothetical protein
MGSHRAQSILVSDLHELASGKLAALLTHHASRDLFNALGLVSGGNRVADGELQNRKAYVLSEVRADGGRGGVRNRLRQGENCRRFDGKWVLRSTSQGVARKVLALAGLPLGPTLTT